MLTSKEFIERLRELGYKVFVNDDRIEIHRPFPLLIYILEQ